MSDEIIIIGSGISAAGACYHLRENGLKAAVYDKNSFPWGHTATHVYEPGYLFDEGPHVSFTSDERIQEIFAESLGGEFDSTPYVLNNYWQGYWATHPVQNHLKGLPPEIVTTIIAEFARLSSDDVEINNYADWLNASYGPTFAKNFPMVYTEKYHTTQAENLTTDWIGPRMHQPDLEQVILGAISENPPNIHYIKNFRYPKSGGFEQYLPSFFKGFDIALNHEVVEISPAEKQVRFADGKVAAYSSLISSIPVPSLVPLIKGAPAEVVEAAKKLAWSGCVLVNIGVERADLTDAHISYVYDEDIVFSRLSFPHNISPSCAPEGCSSVQAEIYFSEKYRPLDLSMDECIERTVADLIRCGLLHEDDVLPVKETVVCPYANVIFDHDRAESLAIVHSYLDEIGVHYCGRYGDWDYMWTDQSFISGERAANNALNGA
tara:strand:+ start:5600 stop:6904 length:1305 start_codon:yes stop_codon:yes gene_type:complete